MTQGYVGRILELDVSRLAVGGDTMELEVRGPTGIIGTARTAVEFE